MKFKPGDYIYSKVIRSPYVGVGEETLKLLVVAAGPALDIIRQTRVGYVSGPLNDYSMSAYICEGIENGQYRMEFYKADYIEDKFVLDEDAMRKAMRKVLGI